MNNKDASLLPAQRAPSRSTIRSLDELPGIPPDERKALEPVLRAFEFRVSGYYASLIDWSDADDPLRKMVLPSVSELEDGMTLDPSDEESVTVAPGVQHKYGPTALVLVSDICAAYCRFCFRKRFTLATSTENHLLSDPGQPGETDLNAKAALRYIAEHPEINNVLVTGGDPLLLSARRLASLSERLAAIPHVRLIRFGSKVPAFDPERITPSLIEALSGPLCHGVSVRVMAHFTHPRELTEVAHRHIRSLIKAGIPVHNQTPLLKGINTDPEILAELFGILTEWSVTPYYLLHCRPTAGNEPFVLSLQEGAEIVERARLRLSGPAKSFRYVASHASGKIEIVGLHQGSLVLRYHQAKYSDDHDSLKVIPADELCFWPPAPGEAVHS
jgi:lysine 2,3-aminomutase